jgi:nitroimidazol reductase NimA-like FMN-containing flavoprotein (pyridoxamine 5'-phosphate oxidase superfamily)
MGELTMSKAEREAFLAGVHVGVLGVAVEGSSPLTVPIWYGYEPGGTVNVITGRTSLKAKAINAAGRFSLCAQTETAPYQYVSVEGTVAVVEDSVALEERREMAYRYLGPEVGDLYMAATESDADGSIVIRMTPERWRTVDYSKQFG